MTRVRILAASTVPLRVFGVGEASGTSAEGRREASGTSAGAPRRGWELHIWLDDGRVHRGEATPLPGYGGGEVAAVAAALEALTGPFGALAGVELPAVVADAPADAAALAALAAVVAGALGADAPPAARCALEQALVEAQAASAGVAPGRWLGGVEGPLPLHLLVADADGARAALACEPAARALKVKVGRAALDDDLRRVAAICAVARGAGLEVVVDANSAWPIAVADAALAALAALGVRRCEEPLAAPTPAALRALRRHGVAIAVDESCRDVASLEALLADSGAAGPAVDALVLKPTCSGLLAALALGRRATMAGLDVCVTTTFDGPLAAQGARWLAQALPGARRLPCGLSAAAVARVERVGGAAAPSAFVPAPVVSAAAADPAAIVLELPNGREISAAALLRRARACAAAGRAAGMLPGDRVYLEARPDLGAIGWLHGLGLLGVEAVLLPPGCRSPAPTPLPRLGRAGRASAQPAGGGRARRAPSAERLWPLDEVRVSVRTSGSTDGAPREVPLTGRQLLMSAAGSAFRLGHAPGESWLSPLPWSGVGGLAVLVRTLLGGGRAVLCRPRAAEIAVRLPRVARASLTPALLGDVLALPEPATTRLAGLRAVLIGGDALPAALALAARRRGLPVVESWGMSEAASQVATAPPGGGAPPDAPARRGLPTLPLAAVGVDGHGALVVTGPLTATGRTTTRDRGRLVGRGGTAKVQLAGRLDDVIISGGAKIDPAAVEAALCRHPAVGAAMVVAVADGRYGQRPAALLVRAPSWRGALPTAATLGAEVARELPRWMVPARIAWLPTLPQAALGKPSRGRGRAWWAAAIAAEGVPG